MLGELLGKGRAFRQEKDERGVDRGAEGNIRRIKGKRKSWISKLV